MGEEFHGAVLVGIGPRQRHRFWLAKRATLTMGISFLAAVLASTLK